MRTGTRLGVALAISAAAIASLLPASAAAFDPVLEARNFAKIAERELYVTATPEFQTRLQQQNARAAATSAPATFGSTTGSATARE